MTPDKAFLKRHAEQLLVLARETANVRMKLTQRAEELYGTNGPWIAGGFQEHWPDHVKDVIRSYANMFGSYTEQSLAMWCMAGCRRITWLHKKESLGVFHY